MAEDAFGFHTKAFATRSVLKNLGKPSFSSCREVGIQGAKLDRMATAFEKKFPWNLTVSTAKLRKEKGSHLHRLTQQSKRVDEAVSRLVEEWVCSQYDLTASQKKQILPKAVGAQVRKMNKRIHQVTKGLRRVFGPDGLGNVKGFLDSWTKPSD